MRQRFVGGNWKMNGNQSELLALTRDILQALDDSSDTDVALFPSFVYLSAIYQLLSQSSIMLGAQTLNEHEKGAYTGEVSASMLKDIGCRYVLIGHSERRHIYGEDNTLLTEKFKIAMQHDLIPILCVGETQTEREDGKTENIILEQLNAVIDKTNIDPFSKAIIAYEPVWAIGTGLSATPEQAQSVHAFIRNTIAKHSTDIAQNLRIIYGGSVKSNNASALFNMPDIDGGLIGGASLNASEFISICKTE